MRPYLINLEDWVDCDSLVDNGEPGIKVRAIYGHEAAESDELDFKAGTTKCLSKCTDFTTQPLTNQATVESKIILEQILMGNPFGHLKFIKP